MQSSQLATFEPAKCGGEHVWVWRFGYNHHGITDGKGGVIHYSGLAAGLKSGPVCRVSWSEFAGARAVHVIRYEPRLFSTKEAVLRAETRLGELAYCVFGNNCEHFVRWCIVGEHSSKQIDLVVTPMASAAGAGALGIAGVGTIAAAAAAGTAGAASTMSGLATVGAVVGGGAIAGAAVLAVGAGALGATATNLTIFKDHVALPTDEREARAVGRIASTTGAAIASAGGIAAIGAAGTAGFSAVGISSGLAAIGGAVGGGMVAGTALVVAGPVAAAVGLGFGVYKVARYLNKKKGKKN